MKLGRITHHPRCRKASCPGKPNCGRLPQFYVEPTVLEWDDGLRGPDALRVALPEAEKLLRELDEIGSRSLNLNSRERLVLRVILQAAKRSR